MTVQHHLQMGKRSRQRRENFSKLDQLYYYVEHFNPDNPVQVRHLASSICSLESKAQERILSYFPVEAQQMVKAHIPLELARKAARKRAQPTGVWGIFGEGTDWEIFKK